MSRLSPDTATHWHRQVFAPLGPLAKQVTRDVNDEQRWGAAVKTNGEGQRIPLAHIQDAASNRNTMTLHCHRCIGSLPKPRRRCPANVLLPTNC